MVTVYSELTSKLKDAEAVLARIEAAKDREEETRTTISNLKTALATIATNCEHTFGPKLIDTFGFRHVTACSKCGYEKEVEK